MLVAVIAFIWLLLYKKYFIHHEEVFPSAYVIGLVLEVVSAGFIANFVFYFVSFHLINEYSKENDFKTLITFTNRLIDEYKIMINSVFGANSIDLGSIEKGDYIDKISVIDASPSMVPLTLSVNLLPGGMTPLQALYNYKSESEKIILRLLSMGLNIDDDIKQAIIKLSYCKLFHYLDDLNNPRLLPGMMITKMDIFASKMWELNKLNIAFVVTLEKRALYHEISNKTK